MLSNAYFLAKFRFDTTENEPAKNLQNFAKIADFPNWPEVRESLAATTTVPPSEADADVADAVAAVTSNLCTLLGVLQRVNL